jgi:hypothetical protein
LIPAVTVSGMFVITLTYLVDLPTADAAMPVDRA